MLEASEAEDSKQTLTRIILTKRLKIGGSKLSSLFLKEKVKLPLLRLKFQRSSEKGKLCIGNLQYSSFEN